MLLLQLLSLKTKTAMTIPFVRYTEIEGSYAELDCDVIASPRLTGEGVYWYLLDPRTQGRNRIQPEKSTPGKYSIQTIAQVRNTLHYGPKSGIFGTNYNYGTVQFFLFNMLQNYSTIVLSI